MRARRKSLMVVLILLIQGCGPATSLAAIEGTATISAATVSASSSPSARLDSGIPDLSAMNVEEWASTSPDGDWIATGLVAFPRPDAPAQTAYVRLLIFRADGKTLWKIIDERQEIGLGFPRPVPLQWSQDGEHLYFSHRVVPDGCRVFESLSDLQRVNLKDGSVQELLPHAALGLAISPDESKLAYLAYGDRGLVVRDLSTGKERDFWIDSSQDRQAGNLVWSPNSESLALTLAIRPCSGSDPSRTVWAESTSILLLDAETLEHRVLIQEDPRLFVTVAWKEPDRITITDGEQNSLWYADVHSGVISRE